MNNLSNHQSTSGIRIITLLLLLIGSGGFLFSLISIFSQVIGEGNFKSTFQTFIIILSLVLIIFAYGLSNLKKWSWYALLTVNVLILAIISYSLIYPILFSPAEAAAEVRYYTTVGLMLFSPVLIFIIASSITLIKNKILFK